MVDILLVGLVSTLHCSTMCGGIMGALSLSLPAELRQRPACFVLFVALYNLGRLASYAVMGAAVGGLGGGALALVPPDWARLPFQGAVALVLVLVGLDLLGIAPRLARLEFVGGPLWRLLEPVGRRALPVHRPAQAVGFGMIWGCMPCGLVYAMLLVALAAGGWREGATVMAAFWLGSLPTLLVAALLTRRIAAVMRSPRLRHGVGAVLVVLGCAEPFAASLASMPAWMN